MRFLLLMLFFCLPLLMKAQQATIASGCSDPELLTTLADPEGFHAGGNGLPCPETPVVTDLDGNLYNTVKVGNQCWMVENLRTTSYQNGASIHYPGNDIEAWGADTEGAYAWLNDEISNKEVYGALYNWFAVNNPNGLCPDGWHVASHDDWTRLERFVCGALGNADCDVAFPKNHITAAWRGDNEGNALKSCRQVDSPLGEECATPTSPRWYNSSHFGRDEVGFAALPGGHRGACGGYRYMNERGRWWTSTPGEAADAWSRIMAFDRGNIRRGPYSQQGGYSVRCVRDI